MPSLMNIYSQHNHVRERKLFRSVDYIAKLSETNPGKAALSEHRVIATYKWDSMALFDLSRMNS
jgi:hypothetical protein